MILNEQELVGVLCGVAIDKVFFSESMHGLLANKSKLAILVICKNLSKGGYKFIDCQVESYRLFTIEASLITRGIYTKLNEPCSNIV